MSPTGESFRFVRACVHAEHRERQGQPACPRHSHAEHLLLYPKVHALEKPTRAMPRSGEPQKLVAAAVEDPVHVFFFFFSFLCMYINPQGCHEGLEARRVVLMAFEKLFNLQNLLACRECRRVLSCHRYWAHSLHCKRRSSSHLRPR